MRSFLQTIHTDVIFCRQSTLIIDVFVPLTSKVMIRSIEGLRQQARLCRQAAQGYDEAGSALHVTFENAQYSAFVISQPSHAQEANKQQDYLDVITHAQSQLPRQQ